MVHDDKHEREESKVVIDVHLHFVPVDEAAAARDKAPEAGAGA